MTSSASTDVKEVIFINQDVFGAYADLPDEVWEAANARTTVLQNGGRLPAQQAKALKGALSGISEIRINHDDNTYRVYFAAEFPMVIYMLDAGIKNSPSGDEIPRPQVERLAKRFQQAKKHYADDAAIIGKRFKEREAERESRLAKLAISPRTPD
jgi:phage-related protein